MAIGERDKTTSDRSNGAASGGEQAVDPVEILLVEDNPGDAGLAAEALSDSRVINRLHHVKDGVEAMAFLARRGRYEGAPRPDLILLDLNLPKKDGLEVLREVKESQEWRRIPVVVLTLSENERDVLASYDLHANCYLTKPIDFDQFMEVVRSIEDFWLTLVRLPED